MWLLKLRGFWKVCMLMEAELDIYREENGIKKSSWKRNLKLRKSDSRNLTQSQDHYTQSYERAPRSSSCQKLLQWVKNAEKPAGSEVKIRLFQINCNLFKCSVNVTESAHFILETNVKINQNLQLTQGWSFHSYQGELNPVSFSWNFSAIFSGL